jgi:hypothetical protein
MKFSTLAVACLLAMAATLTAERLQAAQVSPLTLHVTVGAASGQAGLYRYEFRLALTNLTGTWLPGQGFGGIVFGDVENGPSPIADFALDGSSLPIGPWSSFGASGGFHNGPTLTPLTSLSLSPVIWTPSSLDDYLTWSGRSAALTCDLTFSTLFTSNLGDPAEFQPAVCVPEPATLLMLIGFAFLGARRLAGRRAPSRCAIESE